MPKKSQQPANADDASGASQQGRDPFRILISWSPKSTGTEAIELATWLSQSYPTQVRVISAFIQPWHSTSLQKLGGKYKKWFKKEAETCADAVKAALTDAGLDKSNWDKKYSILVDGPSKPQLLTEAAADFKADIILLGPNQSSPKGRFFAGSTADSLLHYSPVPLGLMPRKAKLAKHGITRMNFAFTDDQGRKDEPALMAAAKLAATLDVPLRILAFSPSAIVSPPTDKNFDVATKLHHDWREYSLSLMDLARDNVLDDYPELDVTTDIGSGTGWAGAVDSLKWKKGDLMVLGSRPLDTITRVFIGSTATELLPHLGVPVLVYPA